MLPKWQKHLPHKLHSQPHLPMETTSYGEAWRAFWKQNFGLRSTTYYSTVPITCTQHGFIVHNHLIAINRWSAIHYDEFHCNDISWRYISFCFARYRSEISLQRSLARTICQGDITKFVPISGWFIILTFNNPCGVSPKYQWEQSQIFVYYRLHYFCSVLYLSTVKACFFPWILSFLFPQVLLKTCLGTFGDLFLFFAGALSSSIFLPSKTHIELPLSC